MAESAKIDSLEALMRFRIALIKFKEKASQAVMEGDAEIRRMQQWLEREQPAYWKRQLQKRQDKLRDAKDQLRSKTMFKNADGTGPKAIEEEKMVRICEQKVREAEEKIQAIRIWKQRIDKGSQMYKGRMQPVVRLADGDMPKAVQDLDNAVRAVEQYLALQAPDTQQGPEGDGDVFNPATTDDDPDTGGAA